MSDGALCSSERLKPRDERVFPVREAGRLFQRPVNHEPSMAHSSALSEDWMSPNWLPGVIPSPSVVNGQFPRIPVALDRILRAADDQRGLWYNSRNAPHLRDLFRSTGALACQPPALQAISE